MTWCVSLCFCCKNTHYPTYLSSPYYCLYIFTNKYDRRLCLLLNYYTINAAYTFFLHRMRINNNKNNIWCLSCQVLTALGSHIFIIAQVPYFPQLHNNALRCQQRRENKVWKELCKLNRWDWGNRILMLALFWGCISKRDSQFRSRKNTPQTLSRVYVLSDQWPKCNLWE